MAVQNRNAACYGTVKYTKVSLLFVLFFPKFLNRDKNGRFRNFAEKFKNKTDQQFH